MMKFRAIVVCGESDCAELNAFLAAHRVLRVERQFEGGAWHFLVEYDERGGDAALAGRAGKPPRVDYREVLSAEDFAVFAKLREVRKRLAEAEGVAVFAVATNEQLAQFAKERATTLAALQAVPGFGESRTEKYGKAFIEAIMGMAGFGTAGGAAVSKTAAAAGKDFGMAETAERSETAEGRAAISKTRKEEE